MLGFLKKNKSGQTKSFKALCQPETPVQIIGDIHGCMDLLLKLEERLDDQVQVVTVGDYVDRGAQSADVLAYLMEKTAIAGPGWVCLRGNHEEMMVNFLDNPEDAGRRWLRYGGLQTLASFGVGGITETADGPRLREGRDQLRAKFPAGLEDWLRRLPLSWRSGNLWVVHAGASPQRPMQEQSEASLVWGHQDFLNTTRSDDIWVAHGHTVVEEPDRNDGRIATDTGAYFTNRLTAAVCGPNGSIEFVDTR